MNIDFRLYILTAPMVVGLVMVAPALVQRWNVGRLLQHALDDVAMTRKEAADIMGLSEGQLSRQLAGIGPDHLSLHRCSRLPRPVWLRLIVGLAEINHLLPDADTRAEHLARHAARTARATLRRDSREGVARESLA